MPATPAAARMPFNSVTCALYGVTMATSDAFRPTCIRAATCFMTTAASPTLAFEPLSSSPTCMQWFPSESCQQGHGGCGRGVRCHLRMPRRTSGMSQPSVSTSNIGAFRYAASTKLSPSSSGSAFHNASGVPTVGVDATPDVAAAVAAAAPAAGAPATAAPAMLLPPGASAATPAAAAAARVRNCVR